MSRATTVSSFDSYSPPSTPIPASIAESEPAAPTSPRDRLPRRTSEEFHRELSARRKAFRRMSRLDDDRVLIGTRVAEGHQNYVLMYNMLTGIRIAVGRVSAKIDRELVEDDFWAAHKLAFDVTGDELTPGARYDFKFKDYAPWVFRHLRAQFGIDPADYLISLTSKYILSELGSPGKSGSFFYYSRDYRYIIKTIHHSEHKCLRRILPDYYNHVVDNPNTLLCRYYGLHRVKLPRGRKIHFVVMGNVFPPHNDIHEMYDLKGSTFGRFLPEEEISKSKNAVMKDLNFEKNKKKLQMGPSKRKLFISQLVRDVKLLVRMNLMDYSLLIGVHYMARGNKENIRNSTLQFFEPDTKTAERRASVMKRRESRVEVYRHTLAQTNPDRLNASELPDEPLEDRLGSVFYTDDGGFRSTDENDRPTSILYYLGVIDILTAYDAKKKSEHFFKSMTHDKHAISSVNAAEYGDRFMGFMANAIEHNQDIPLEYQMTTGSTY
ncbi:SAICAR synthase-like protein [Lichtheimia hyalospora FSU 10163]|nr:SAICAR synthase-like protein [Lichtheimia hyalospora FSU 10163]